MPVLFLPRPALADKAPRVGVVISVQVNLKKEEAQQISQALGHALRTRLVVDVVAGAEAFRRLPADGVSESCVADEACIKDTAQRLSADELLFVVAVRMGNRIQVDSTWVDPANGRSASRPKVVMVKIDEAEARFSDAASLILPDAAVRATQQTGQEGAGDGPQARAFLIRTTPRHMTLPAWITLGAGVAAGGAWLPFFLVTRHDYNELQDHCAPLGDCNSNPAYDDVKDKISRNSITADVLGVASIGLGITTAILWWNSGGDIERVPVAARSVRLQVDPGTRSTMLFWEGNL
ncbi:MAG TPA: hypothetical protein VKB80_08255 [Kofleriaceae bacterium]|nr:hypothetical protein [Kofleriaceae bacterium]